jgi:hypothetical protein
MEECSMRSGPIPKAVFVAPVVWVLTAAAPAQPTVDIADSGYIEKLKKIDPQRGERGGLKIEASVVPDAYLLIMAEALAELEALGYEGEEIEKRLRRVHLKNRKYRGKVLLLVTIEGRDSKTFAVLTRKFQVHGTLKQGTRGKTYTITKATPKPAYETWQVFDGTGRGLKSRTLCAFQKLKLRMLSTSVRPDNKDPVRFTLENVAVQSQRVGGLESINPKARQIATKEWNALVVKELTVTFSPKRWKLPKPPPEFEALLEKLQ